MVTRYTHGELVWIDLVSPTQEEVRDIMEEFSIDTLIADELLAPSTRNRVDPRDDYFYLVLHFPAFKHLHDMAHTMLELDFVVGKQWIITTRYDGIDPLHQFSKLFEVDSVLDRKNMTQHAGNVLYYMLFELYRMLYDELAHIETRLDTVEDHIFEGLEREMVAELSRISRDLLNYAQALDSHHTMLQSLETPGVALFGYEYVRHIRTVVSEYERLAASIKSSRASLLELRETNNSLLTTKQNEIMKNFTIMAFLMLPLSLVSSVFGMNVAFMPIAEHPHGFAIIVGLMVAIAVFFAAFFKHRHWL
jgi:magnesium transporter